MQFWNSWLAWFGEILLFSMVFRDVLLSLYLRFYVSWLSFRYIFIPSTRAVRASEQNSRKLVLSSLICDVISIVHPSLLCVFASLYGIANM